MRHPPRTTAKEAAMHPTKDRQAMQTLPAGFGA